MLETTANGFLPSGPDRIDRYAGQDFKGRVTLDNWQESPFNRWGFAHISELITTATIRRGSLCQPTSRTGSSSVRHGEKWHGVEDFLTATQTDAIVVLQDGKVVMERYFGAFHSRDRHVLMSVSKSVCALVVGILVGRGLIDTEQSVHRYVHALKGSAYGDATVRQVLDMTAAVQYSEDYLDSDAEVQQQDRIAGWRPKLETDAGDTYEFLTRLKPSGEHGQSFQYCSAGTDVLAWIIENVTGKRYADVVSDELWSRLLTEDDALITTDSGGFAFANGGIACTARDLAKIGQLLLDDGNVNGRTVVPSWWISDTMRGGDPLLARGSAYQKVHPEGSYRNQWWVLGDERGTLYAAGIHGQFIWIDPVSNTVIAKFSSCAQPVGLELSRAHATGFRQIVSLLENRPD
ncbi:serine hydrolase [Paenarthrobacter nicotinovorans]|uniref:Serine hydrolase n=1 Tax=Paenarthrobacter nicotinovorans TaxID=29320 RepID=A0ABV0GZ80_PAENI|nr:serine hydrolase [Paenarthrobacter nicotinovorans]